MFRAFQTCYWTCKHIFLSSTVPQIALNISIKVCERGEEREREGVELVSCTFNYLVTWLVESCCRNRIPHRSPSAASNWLDSSSSNLHSISQYQVIIELFNPQISVCHILLSSFSSLISGKSVENAVWERKRYDSCCGSCSHSCWSVASAV